MLKPIDIINFRKRYNISQRELTAILGYGKMTINRYERGDIPNYSSCLLLYIIINYESVFFDIVISSFCTGRISQKTFYKIVKEIFVC